MNLRYREASSGIDPVNPYCKSFFFFFFSSRFFFPRTHTCMNSNSGRPERHHSGLPPALATLRPAACSDQPCVPAKLRSAAAELLRLPAARPWRRQAPCSSVERFYWILRKSSNPPYMTDGCCNIREPLKKITGYATYIVNSKV